MDELVIGILIGVISSVVLALLGWLGNKLRKALFPPRRELCDLLLVNTDKNRNVFHRRYLKELVSEDSYCISVVAYTDTSVKVEDFVINFGTRKSYPSRIREIIQNRLRAKRLLTAPNPNWWRDFRVPKLESQSNQPQIKRLVAIHYTDNKSTIPINVDQSFIYNDECHIVFDESVEIPKGYPYGRHIRIVLELVNLNSWKGVIRLSSSVNGVNEYVLRKVEIVRK